MKTRTEHDTMGSIEVPVDKYWGAQTQRSLEHFEIGIEKMPQELIKAFAILKMGAAEANFELGQLNEQKFMLIKTVCNEILDNKLESNFPLSVWQTGSGTQSNMNVNEVIANRGNQIANEKILHPNDDVNKSQSSNDTFPTAMSIAAIIEIEEKLIPAISELINTFLELENANKGIIKTGRTHLMDAVPLSFSQEISGWRTLIERNLSQIKLSLGSSQDFPNKAYRGLKDLALGGTAVGTGLNTVEGFAKLSAEHISKISNHSFFSADNKFRELSGKDSFVFAHAALKALACNLMKIANDIRLLASGPRCGLGEIFIPENEPGSSIMPGKVNPTQCEAVTMVAVQVMGNDSTIAIASSQGNFELNVFMPVIIYNFLQSVSLLTDVTNSFNKNCIKGIKANTAKMNDNLTKSLMLVTALNPFIGYEKAAATAKKALTENISLAEAAQKLGFLTQKEFNNIVKPENMI